MRLCLMKYQKIDIDKALEISKKNLYNEAWISEKRELHYFLLEMKELTNQYPKRQAG